MKHLIVRAKFYHKDGLLFIREQEVSEHDTLKNCLRRHAVWCNKRFTKSPEGMITSFVIEVTSVEKKSL